MGRKVALDGFLGHFFPLRLYRLVGVRRRGGGKGADVLEEGETEVFDLRRKSQLWARARQDTPFGDCRCGCRRGTTGAGR